MSSIPSHPVAGIFLWGVFTLAPFVIIFQQFRRYKANLPYSWQPLQGLRHAANPTNVPSLTTPWLYHLCSFVCLLTALCLNVWGILGWDTILGLVNMQNRILETTLSITCPIGYDSSYYYYTGTPSFDYTLKNESCFLVAGPSVTVLILSIFTLAIYLYQLVIMFPWYNLRKYLMSGQDQLEAALPGMWARTYVLLALHYAMIFLYGGVLCLWAGVTPFESAALLLFSTFLARAQYYLLQSFIEAHPPPAAAGAGSMPGFPQAKPAPGVAPAAVGGWVSAANTVAAQPAFGVPQQQNPYFPSANPYSPEAYAAWVAANAAAAHHFHQLAHPQLQQQQIAPSFYPPPAVAAVATPAVVVPSTQVPSTSLPVPSAEGAVAAHVRVEASPATPAAVIAAAEVSAVSVCASCGNSGNRVGAAFCSTCGAKM